MKNPAGRADVNLCCKSTDGERGCD